MCLSVIGLNVIYLDHDLMKMPSIYIYIHIDTLPKSLHN